MNMTAFSKKICFPQKIDFNNADFFTSTCSLRQKEIPNIISNQSIHFDPNELNSLSTKSRFFRISYDTYSQDQLSISFLREQWNKSTTLYSSQNVFVKSNGHFIFDTVDYSPFGNDLTPPSYLDEDIFNNSFVSTRHFRISTSESLVIVQNPFLSKTTASSYFLFFHIAAASYLHDNHKNLELFIPYIDTYNIYHPEMNYSQVLFGLFPRVIQKEEVVFVRNLYTFVGTDINFKILELFRKKVAESMNLDKVPPSHYYIFGISNYSQSFLLKEIAKVRPSISFELILPSQNISQAIQTFNSAILVIGHTHPYLLWCMFMQPGTTLCEILLPDSPNYLFLVTNFFNIDYLAHRDRQRYYRFQDDVPDSTPIVKKIINKYFSEFSHKYH